MDDLEKDWQEPMRACQEATERVLVREIALLEAEELLLTFSLRPLHALALILAVQVHLQLNVGDSANARTLREICDYLISRMGENRDALRSALQFMYGFADSDTGVGEKWPDESWMVIPENEVTVKRPGNNPSER